MAHILITGANRGIGLGLTKSYLSKGHSVIAACRNPDGERDLWELQSDHPDTLQLLTWDVCADCPDLASVLPASQPLDLLFNNAGRLAEPGKGMADLALDEVAQSFAVNTLGPMRVIRGVLPSLQRAAEPKVINITSEMGSIAGNASGFAYAYRMSKAALNMMNRSFSLEYPNIISVVLHPGWVQTAMGGPNARIGISESVAGIVAVANGLTKQNSGQFFNYRGELLPW